MKESIREIIKDIAFLGWNGDGTYDEKYLLAQEQQITKHFEDKYKDRVLSVDDIMVIDCKICTISKDMRPKWCKRGCGVPKIAKLIHEAQKKKMEG